MATTNVIHNKLRVPNRSLMPWYIEHNPSFSILVAPSVATTYKQLKNPSASVSEVTKTLDRTPVTPPICGQIGEPLASALRLMVVVVEHR